MVHTSRTNDEPPAQHRIRSKAAEWRGAAVVGTARSCTGSCAGSHVGVPKWVLLVFRVEAKALVKTAQHSVHAGTRPPSMHVHAHHELAEIASH